MAAAGTALQQQPRLQQQRQLMQGIMCRAVLPDGFVVMLINKQCLGQASIRGVRFSGVTGTGSLCTCLEV